MCQLPSSNSSSGLSMQAYLAMLGAAGQGLKSTYAAAPLPILVRAVLAELIGTRTAFTAYDVTMILRALFPYPLRELPHCDRQGAPGVQPEVHRQMACIARPAGYTVAAARPNGVDVALVYAPNKRRGRRTRITAVAPTTVVQANGVSLPARAWVVCNVPSNSDVRS